jgi:membrane glycosyltransferase
MTPVILGLLLSIPIAILSSSSAGRPQAQIVQDPGADRATSVLTRANELASAPHPPPACPLHELRRRYRPARGAPQQLSPDKSRESVARSIRILRLHAQKIEDAETFRGGGGLSQRTREVRVCFKSPAVLAVLLELRGSRCNCKTRLPAA